MLTGVARIAVIAVALPLSLAAQARQRARVAAPAPAPSHWALAPDGNEARFIVREQLTIFQSPNDAIGTTQAVTGNVTLLPDGRIDSANSRITVDLRTLTTDKANRDRYIKSHTLVTDSFPDAVFVPAALSLTSGSIGIPGPFAGTITGLMTMHGTTAPVRWDVAGTVAGDDISGTATTHVHFGDFNMTQPRVMIVVSVIDDLKLEYVFHFVKASASD